MWPSRRPTTRPLRSRPPEFPIQPAHRQGDPVNTVHPSRPAPSRKLVALLLTLPAIGILATSCAKSDDAASSKDAVKVTITDDGCKPSPTSTPSGQVTFAISNDGSAKATEAELKT